MTKLILDVERTTNWAKVRKAKAHSCIAVMIVNSNTPTLLALAFKAAQRLQQSM